MTKKAKTPERVLVEKGTQTASPLVEDVKDWLAKGWKVADKSEKEKKNDS